MKADDCTDFKWLDLLNRMGLKNVIPVIGEGLYWVQTPDGGEALLYPYLAEKLAQEMNLPPVQNKETFHQAVFRFLEKKPDDYPAVRGFLEESFKSLYPVPEGPLQKLARLKSFSLFINTTYDHFLEKILKSTRSFPTEVARNTPNEKGANELDPRIFKSLKAGQRSLIFNIYGSAAASIAPAYTEKDILETIVSLQKDMEVDRENKFFQLLESSSLLFMGCRYDDWLFRFFIRAVTNKAFDKQTSPQSRQFIGDDFPSFNCGGLERFLKAHGTEVYYSCGNREFVDTLFEKIQERYPGESIASAEFPETAFISFHGHDRAAAEDLATRLKEDGINTWYDQWDLKPGEVVDETIAKAISATPVFIPIISAAAQQFKARGGLSVHYHIREWEWAYGRYTEGQNPLVIIPVIIDDTAWRYDAFEKFAYLTIPGGKRQGEYEKLKKWLLEMVR
jgi:hypothetical protein